MRVRNSARAIVLNRENQVLLFRFIFGEGQYEKILWVTPGGGLENGESFSDAIIRELDEETGITIEHTGNVIAERELEIHITNKTFISHEKYFLIRNFPTEVILDKMTSNEKNTLLHYKWWSLDDLIDTNEEVAPPELAALISRIIKGENIEEIVSLK